MNKILGLTGNIGSGKSSVSKFFELINWPVFNSDVSAKTIINQDIKIKNELIGQFGSIILNTDQSISNQKLAELGLVKENVQKLNSIIHPAVKRMFEKWLTQQNSPYVVRESALLFEASIYTESFKNILVVCPFEERLKRVLKRGGISEESIREREALQLPEEAKLPLADFVIDNYNKPVLPQLINIKLLLEKEADL